MPQWAAILGQLAARQRVAKPQRTQHIPLGPAARGLPATAFANAQPSNSQPPHRYGVPVKPPTA